MAKPRFSYDPDCGDLADHFLADSPHLNTPLNRDKLAQTIQDAIEEWFAEAADYDGPTDDQIANGIGMEGGVRYRP